MVFFTWDDAGHFDSIRGEERKKGAVRTAWAGAPWGSAESPTVIECLGLSLSSRQVWHLRKKGAFFNSTAPGTAVGHPGQTYHGPWNKAEPCVGSALLKGRLGVWRRRLGQPHLQGTEFLS